MAGVASRSEVARKHELIFPGNLVTKQYFDPLMLVPPPFYGPKNVEIFHMISYGFLWCWKIEWEKGLMWKNK